MPTAAPPAPNTAFSVGESMMVSGGAVNPETGRSFYGTSEVVPEGLSVADAIRHAGLDYNVVQRPIHHADGTLMEGFLANCREDDPAHPFGIVTPKYKTIQNLAGFAVAEHVMGEGGAKPVAGGKVGNGRKAWLMLTLPEALRIAGDEVLPYLLFVNTHDGTESIGVANVPTRLRCTNALTLTMRTAMRASTGGDDNGGVPPRGMKIRHTGDVAAKIAEAQRVMGMADRYLREFATVGDLLAQKRLSDRKLKALLDKLYPTGTTDRKEANAAEARAEVRRLVNEAPNLEGHHGTAWAFVNAVGELADWGSTRERDRMDRLCYNADGTIKDRAMGLVLDSVN